MDVFWDFIVNQVGVQGIFFVFTLVLAKLFYDEKQADKLEFKERDQESKEREKAQIEREIKLSEQLGNAIEVIQKFEKNFETINTKIDQLSIEVKSK